MTHHYTYIPRKKTTIEKLIRVAFVVVPVVTLGTCAVTVIGVRLGDSHDDGYSVGTLINVRDEGVLWSRPAATLLHTGEMKGDEFALDTPELLVKANHFADQSARVKVKYAHRYVCWAWNYASCNIITDIQPDPGLK